MAHDDHSAHHVKYIYVFFALCGFTALSVLFDALPMGGHTVTIVLVLAVAVAKALCVMMFFMHLKFEGNWKYVLLAPTTILAIGLPLALMPDIGVAYYIPTARQADWKSEMDDFHTQHSAHDDADAQAHKDGDISGHPDEKGSKQEPPAH